MVSVLRLENRYVSFSKKDFLHFFQKLEIFLFSITLFLSIAIQRLFNLGKSFPIFVVVIPVSFCETMRWQHKLSLFPAMQ